MRTMTEFAPARPAAEHPVADVSVLPERRGVLRTGSRWLRGALAHNAETLAWLLPVLAIAAAVQAVNMGGSPQRIDDEGTYTAQAWAILNLGELAHYTYWYDHPPLGWIQIAAWTGATGAFDRYDVAVLAAREAMVVATLVSVALVWSIARRIGLGRGASAAASLIFAVSPLAVQFHRTVYLDNVATPWLLASVLLAMTRHRQLAGFAASSAALGIAVLSKETYLLALPLVVYLMWRGAHPSTRRYTLSVAATILVIVGGSYLLFAAVKGELAPGADRVSLWEGIAFQLGTREASGSVFDPQSLAGATASVWVQLDPVLVILAPLAALAGLFIRSLRAFAITLAVLILVIFRPGGYLPVPYVIMLLPFAALLIAGVTDSAIRSWRRRSRTPRGIRTVPNAVWAVVVVVAVAAAVPMWGTQLRGLLLADLDAPSRQAQDWVEDNVPQESRLIVDDTMWVDLVEAGFDRSNVIWFYKLDTDPAVQAESPGGWRDSDFVVTTDSMLTSPNASGAVDAVANSVVVASFGEGDQQVQVRRINPEGADAAARGADASEALRVETGQELASNPDLEASAADLDRLAAGQVDNRIVIALGSALARGTVSVGDLPIVPGEEGQIFRQVVIDRIADAPLVENGRPTPAATDLLAAIGGRFAPLAAVPTEGGLLLTFSVIAPGGLVL